MSAGARPGNELMNDPAHTDMSLPSRTMPLAGRVTVVPVPFGVRMAGLPAETEQADPATKLVAHAVLADPGPRVPKSKDSGAGDVKLMNAISGKGRSAKISWIDPIVPDVNVPP